MQDLLEIRSVQELNTALSQQRSFTRRALSDLDSVGERMLPKEISEEDEPRIAAELKAKEINLLEYYAKFPTLTEFQQVPELRGLSGDGGTFGVSAIVAELILAQVRTLEIKFVRMHRYIMLLLMKEMDDPASQEVDLVDPVIRFMRFELDESLKSLGEEERRKLVHGLMRPLVQAMLAVMGEYGLIESPDEHGYILTVLGKRVMLHLFDAEKFIDTVGKAHRSFQPTTATE